MKEADLYLPIVAGALSERWGLYRIQDGTPGRKPFDIGGTSPLGRAVGLEVKIIRAPIDWNAPIPWNLFAKHQRAWLAAYCRSNALALVGLYDSVGRTLYIFRLKWRNDDIKPLRELCYVALEKRTVEKTEFYAGWQELLEKIDRQDL